jgi:hypothetical protein
VAVVEEQYLEPLLLVELAVLESSLLDIHRRLKMSELNMIVEIDCSTGESITRELTADEALLREKSILEHEKQRLERVAEDERVNALKVSARAKLVLGQPLTEEEASVLVI